MSESRTTDADVIVVGGGVIGTAIVAELNRHGIDCIIIESGVPGREVSDLSFAWVNAHEGKSPLSYRKLNLAGLEAHHRLHESGEAPWFHPTGSIELGVDRHEAVGSRETSEAIIGDYDDLAGQAPVIALGSEERARLGLSPHINSADLYPRDGWVDVALQIQMTLKSLPRGHVLTGTRAVALQRGGGGEHPAIRLADGRVLSAQQIVLASGNGTPDLMETVRPGLEIVENAERSTHVGLSVETFPLDNPLTSVVRGPGVSLRPTRDGGAVIADHATAASHRLTDPELLSIPKILISRAKDLLPALGDIKVRTVRIGPRVWPLDGRTVCGWLTDRVYVALTHSGVTLAPFIADCVRQELQGDEAHELVDFRPDRFEKD